jgi:RNA polymerase sigma factor (sigma-70 family)
LSLTSRQQKLFDDHHVLVKHVVARYRRAYPDVCQDRDELLQMARLGLVRAAQRWDETRGVPFQPYARKIIAWKVAAFLFGDMEGSVSRRASRRHEVSWSEPIGEEFTRGDLAEQRLAIEEENLSVPEDRNALLYFEIRQAVKNLETLTSFERRVLKLRFFDGFENKFIAKKLRVSGMNIKRTLRSAIQKLRVHFPGALPPEAPLPQRGNDKGCNWSVRRKSSQNAHR